MQRNADNDDKEFDLIFTKLKQARAERELTEPQDFKYLVAGWENKAAEDKKE